MICLETKHFRLNRFLLLAIGLWPHQRSKLTQIQFIVLFTILTTFVVFQFTTFITSKCTADLIMNVLSSAFFSICYAIKYHSFWINANTMRVSLEQLQHVCNEIKNKDEIAIIEKYGRIGKRQTRIITIFAVCGTSIYLILPFWPRIFDVILAINNSRSRSAAIHIATEYFVDQENFSYLILLHTSAALCIGGTAMTATGTMLIAYLKHICGMFSIASFRIKKAMTINMQQDVTEEKMVIIYKGIICGIDIHRRAIEFSQVYIKNFEGSFFCLIAASMICLSSTLVQIISYNNTEQLVFGLVKISVLYVYMFLSNYTAQDITDHNEYVFATVYDVVWYVAPLHIQKMMLFLLQKGTKAFHLILGGIFIASMESAAMLMGTSISYFTVLYSTSTK